MIKYLPFKAIFLRLFFLSFLLLTTLLSVSCSRDREALFPVHGTAAPLFAMSREAVSGVLDFSNPGNLEYRFDSAFPIPLFSSLEIEYYFSHLPSREIKENYKLVLETADISWVLPMDIVFLGVPPYENAVFHYAVPLTDSFNGHFNISLRPVNGAATGPGPVLQIRSVRLVDRWFGFETIEKGGNRHFFLSPFVFMKDNGIFAVDVPEFFNTGPNQRPAHITLPYQPFAIAAGTPHAGSPPFPVPIAACPRDIIDWPRESWRNNGFEVFRWDRFPSILILDTADYAMQERLVKRLAFFVEKRGFRGRLSHDHEIYGLHGWNAHDYSAYHLAIFFNLARQTNFPLLPEERLLERILLNEGVIRQQGVYIIPGEGALLSISREAPRWLRFIFMAHEGFHGLFFIDEDFQNFTNKRWAQLHPQARAFFKAFLEHMEYDTSYHFLLMKEFSGYVLERPVSQMAHRFGQNLPSRILNYYPYNTALPPRCYETGTWPLLAQAFTAEAEAFSAFVNQRWGLAAGRVWPLQN